MTRYIFYFSCSHTIHNIPGSQYLEYVDPGNVLLVLYSFVFKGDATLKKKRGFLRRFSPPLSLSLSLSTIWIFLFGNDNYRYRYRYRSYFGLIVPKRFWFRYLTLLATLLWTYGHMDWSNLAIPLGLWLVRSESLRRSV